jgi:hypothetical protein
LVHDPYDDRQAFTEFQGELYFQGRGPNGVGLFKTDGANVTEMGLFGWERDTQFFEVNNNLFFNGQGPNGWELFKTDGTTVTGFDINPNGDAFAFHNHEFAEFAEIGRAHV